MSARRRTGQPLSGFGQARRPRRVRSCGPRAFNSRRVRSRAGRARRARPWVRSAGAGVCTDWGSGLWPAGMLPRTRWWSGSRGAVRRPRPAGLPTGVTARAGRVPSPSMCGRTSPWTIRRRASLCASSRPGAAPTARARASGRGEERSASTIGASSGCSGSGSGSSCGERTSTSRIIASVTARERSPSSSVISRSRSRRSSGVMSIAAGTATGASIRAGEKCAARRSRPAGVNPLCGTPAGIHSPMLGVTLQTRPSTLAVEAPRSLHSSSWVGWECSAQRVSREIASWPPWIVNGTSTESAASRGRRRVCGAVVISRWRRAPAARGR